MGLKNILVSAINNPKLMLGLGIAGFVGAGVWACVQTVKLETIIDEQNDIQDAIIENHSEEELQLSEVKKELNIVKAKTVGRIALNYAGPVAVAGVAAFLLFRSYGLQKQAYLAMSAAYGTISKAYDAVLDRVEKKWGQEGLKYAKYGIEKKEVGEAVSIDEKGKSKKEKIYEDAATERWEDMKASSPNIIIFDEDTPVYKNNGGNPVLIRNELTTIQNGLDVMYHSGTPVMYNADIVKNTCGNDARWMTDAGQVLGCYSGDPECRKAINDCVDFRINTFLGTDPETGDPKTYVYIDPNVALVNFDKNRTVWPEGSLQKHNIKKRVGGKYLSQI